MIAYLGLRVPSPYGQPLALNLYPLAFNFQSFLVSPCRLIHRSQLLKARAHLVGVWSGGGKLKKNLIFLARTLF